LLAQKVVLGNQTGAGVKTAQGDTHEINEEYTENIYRSHNRYLK